MAELRDYRSSIQIENISPSINHGRYPVKRIMGEACVVTADIFKEGYDPLYATLHWKKKTEKDFHAVSMTAFPNDIWKGEFLLKENTRYLFMIEAWSKSAKEDVVRTQEFEVIADRKRAIYGSWYEFFIRSQTVDASVSGTFRDAEHRLREIKAMGFDVAYLTPIHPIGTTNRKGRNNSLVASANDPGSPWAVGNASGGHTAIDPALGTLDDFDRFVRTARQLDMEVALDFATQCSPDHPWVKAHPDWFYRNPDGSIQHAENPPHKYQDIYMLNFDTFDWKALWKEIYEVLMFWIQHGVRIFRVDNPHTKPLPFWEWLIREIQMHYPDVIFLAEAFTRPKMMKALSKVGFTQSYTYFIWRNTRVELTDYIKELTSSGMENYFRPNFFITTPDNIHEYLQVGGRPAFKIRLALAATLSPTYGIYSGYELCERDAVAGTEHYLNSEVFEIKPRRWDKEGNIVDYVTRLNMIRKENPALQTLTNIKFFQTDNGQLLFYARMTPDKSNIIFVAVNLDPHSPHHGHVWIPLSDLGMKQGDTYEVVDLITGAGYSWGERNYVRLDPQIEPAHVFRVERRFS